MQSQCRPFHVAGFNAYSLAELAMAEAATHPSAPLVTSAAADGRRSVHDAAPTPAAALLTVSGRELVAESLARAASLELNTVRTWAHTSDGLRAPFQVELFSR